MISNLGYFWGGAAIGAVGLGIASYMIDKHDKPLSTEDPYIGCEGELDEGPQSDCAGENCSAFAEEAL